MDDKNRRFKQQRNQEPETVDMDLTGTNPAGNSLGPEMSIAEQVPRIEATDLIWIEQADQAKQGMARKVDMRNASAAPNHPHIGHVPGSGEIQ